MSIPSGIPNVIAIIAATNVIEIVFIVFSHISKYPISRRITTTVATTFIFLDPNHAMTAIIVKIINQGVFVKNCSDSIKKNLTGLNKLSILSP